MKYFIKAITTNNRDLKSGILFSFEDKAYLFNCPDGFQRMALNQRMKFKAVRYVFLSSLHPNHYGGLPGFFLSSRESSIYHNQNYHKDRYYTPIKLSELYQKFLNFIYEIHSKVQYFKISMNIQIYLYEFYLSIQTAEDAKAFKIGIVGPEQLQSLLIKGRSFIGSLNYTELYEYGKLNKFMSERFINGQPMLQEFYSQHVQAQQNAEQVQNNQGQEEEKKSYENQEIPNYHTFDDGDLKIIPVRVFSVDQQEVDCYSFICIPKQPPGKFQPKKAIELGLDPRFHFKILTSGQPVTLQNGDIIYPFQVIDNPLPSQSVIFVFIPNVNYLESFLSEENKALFSPFFEENIDSSKNQMHLIYHSIPFEVLMNQNYRNFMAQFGSNIQHVIDCESCNDEIIAKTKGYALTSRHQAVCPSLIPISQPKLRKLAKENKEKLDEFLDGMKYINSQMGLVYNLYPSNSQGIQTNQIITSEEYNNQIEQELRAELRETVKNLISMRKVDDPNFKQETYNLDAEIDGKEPQILFLGTISMKPTMYRSASAIYLFIKGHGILMDCAEGSYGQIYDHFQDIEKTNEAISKLRVAFITHIHGDHQLGIIKIMTEREKLLNGHDENNKLYIVTPKPMYDYMDEYRKLILKYPVLFLILNSNQYPDMVVLVPAADLNPEGQFYYDEEEQPHNPKRPNLVGQKSPKLQQTQKQDCPERTYDEVNEMIKNHVPKDERSREMLKSKQQSNDFDDDFDYQEGDEKSIVQNQNTGIKTESVNEIQKLSIEKDAIIAERNEQDENEDDLLAQQQLLSQNQTNPNKPSYLSKFSKITQLYDESTKEYKTQQKELGIKQEEQAIVMKAKLEMSKIEEYKAKFLQSAFGGVITNQLAASLERITGKHRLSEEQIQVINNQKPNLKIAQKQAEQEKSDDKNKIKQMSNREEINQIQIQAELETAEITNKNGKQSKKKKKKTKKIKLSNTYIDKQISDVQQSIQDQPIQGKQNNHEDDEENIDDIDEQDGNNTLSHMILGKNTIDSQSSNRGVEKFIQNKALQQEEEAVDWDALNKKNQKNKQGNLNEYINDEEEKQDLQKRQHIITYDESITYFSSKADLSPQLREVEQQENQKARNAGFFSNIASCIFISKLQNEQLNNERMLLLSISRLPFNYEVAEHEIMIKSIYKKLMKNEGQCRSIGNHWVDIGFQSSDPKRDIRGAGMLGVLQLLFFVDNFRESSHLILDHSRNQKHEFPLACQMFEYSVITIRLLKDQKINKLCNKEGEVLTSTNFVFCALFLRFITLYIENGFSITKVGELTAQIETEARNKLDSILKQFYKITDKAVVVLIKACYKRQKDIAQQRLKQLASQSQQFEIKKTEYVNPREKQQQQNSSQAKARNYASKDEDSGTTKMSQHNTQTQQNKQKQSSEFSAF